MTVSAWERGLQTPGAAKHRRLAEVLGVSPRLLRDGTRHEVSEAIRRRGFAIQGSVVEDHTKPEPPLSSLHPTRNPDAEPKGKPPRAKRAGNSRR